MKIFHVGVIRGRWHIDLAGPLPETVNGNRYILLAVEAFSGFPMAIPLKTKTAEETAQALVTHVFSIFGSPSQILSDQGGNFDADLMKEVLKIYGIYKSRTAALHASANGRVERFIRTLKEHLKFVANKEQGNWDQVLPLILQAYRATVHSSEKYSTI